MADNTYYIRATLVAEAEYTVEAESEEEAINKVQDGYVDYDSVDVQSIEDCEITDVEYGCEDYEVTITAIVAVSGQQGKLISEAADDVASDIRDYVRGFRSGDNEVVDAFVKNVAKA